MLAEYLESKRRIVEDALARYANQTEGIPNTLADAMRYSLLAGGKRLRPILTMAAAEVCGGSATAVLPCACALEMIHTFSLVHDDLPAMDNDDLRRGKPTNHKVFGDAQAILAGDALLIAAFECLTEPSARTSAPPATLLAVLYDIARASGGHGMTGGQSLDLLGEQQQLTAAQVEQLHAYKTGALIRVALTSGAQLAGGSPEAVANLARYGDAVGLAFQIADDLLAIEGTTEELGKQVGNDAAHGKATYPAMVGVDVARQRMHQLTDAAVHAVRSFGDAAQPLVWLAEYIVQRRS